MFHYSKSDVKFDYLCFFNSSFLPESGTIIPDPEPGKSFGSKRVRFHNTGYNDKNKKMRMLSIESNLV